MNIQKGDRVDRKTIKVYDTKSDEIASNHANSTPNRLYLLAKAFFKPSDSIADIGCGSGRDTDFFYKQGSILADYQLCCFSGC